MTTRRRATAQQTLLRKSAELSAAAPQVVSMRLARMAQAGAQPSARDQQEFQRMGTEKVQAFSQAWMAMGLEAMQAQQRLALSMMRNPWMGWPGMASAWMDAATRVAGKGLAPVHQRAVSNAKRLARTR